MQVVQMLLSRAALSCEYNNHKLQIAECIICKSQQIGQIWLYMKINYTSVKWYLFRENRKSKQFIS